MENSAINPIIPRHSQTVPKISNTSRSYNPWKIVSLLLSLIIITLVYIGGVYFIQQNNQNDFVPIAKPTLVPTIIPTQVPTRTPTPVPTSVPTIIPTIIPVTPTPTSDANQLRCIIITQPQSGVKPFTTNLIYGVANINSSASVTGIQWDFNGDGTWDTDFSLTNGNLNHTYSDTGVYNIKMHVQLSDGRITDTCSASIAVQPN